MRHYNLRKRGHADDPSEDGSSEQGAEKKARVGSERAGSVPETPTGQTGKGRVGSGKKGISSKGKSNWNIDPYPEEELGWAFDVVMPLEFKKRFSERIPEAKKTTTETGSPVPPPMQWVGEPRTENPPENNLAAGLDQSRSKVLASLGYPAAEIPNLSRKHTVDIIDHLFGNPEDKQWLKLRDGKSRITAQPSTHAVLFWTAGVTELMRFKYELFAPQLWCNKGSYAFKAAEAFLSGVIGYIKDSEDAKKKAEKLKAGKEKKGSVDTGEMLQQKKDRLLPRTLHDFERLNREVCFQIESKFDGKTTLGWDECWAWEDGENPMGKGLRSRLQQDIEDCEAVERFRVNLKVANPEDAAEEATITDGYYSAMIDSQDRLNRVVSFAMRFGAVARAGAKKRIEVVGEFKMKGKGRA